MTLQERIAQYKRTLCREVLAQHNGNKSAASRELGIHRNTLDRILRRDNGSPVDL